MRMGTTTLFIICSAIWGSTWLAIKYQLGVVAPELSVAYRFALAAIVLFAWCMVTRRSLRFSTIVFMTPAGMRLAFGTPLSTRTLIAAKMGVAGVTLLFLPELDQATQGGSAGYGVAFALGATVIAGGGYLMAF